MMYRAMSEYLSSWTREHEPNFECSGSSPGGTQSAALRDVMTRFSMPFGFYPSESQRQATAREAGSTRRACRW